MREILLSGRTLPAADFLFVLNRMIAISGANPSVCRKDARRPIFLAEDLANERFRLATRTQVGSPFGSECWR